MTADPIEDYYADEGRKKDFLKREGETAMNLHPQATPFRKYGDDASLMSHMITTGDDEYFKLKQKLNKEQYGF